MSTIAIVQAHLASTRLPGKAMMPLGARKAPMVQRVVERVRLATRVDDVVVAMPNTFENEEMAEYLGAHDTSIYRHDGPEWDVLGRFRAAAVAYHAETILRVTSDCPFADPVVIDRLLKEFASGQYDYVCNNLPPTYPHGLDAEAFSFRALCRADRETSDHYWREHVTEAFRRQPDLYRLVNVPSAHPIAAYRLTVDYLEDLALANRLLEILDIRSSQNGGAAFTTKDVVWLIDHRREFYELMYEAQERCRRA